MKYKKIGDRIRQLRTERHFTQMRLAEGLCTPSMISQVESGKAMPSLKLLQQLADKLGVAYSLLIAGTEYLMEVRVQTEILRNYVEKKMYDQALELSALLLAENKDGMAQDQYLEVCFDRSEALMRTGQTDEAIKLLNSFEKALTYNISDHAPYMARLYNKTGTAYFLTGDLLQAYGFYCRAQQVAERLPVDFLAGQIEYNLGNTLYWLNREVEAVKHLGNAKDIYQSVTRMDWLANSLYMMGLCFHDENQFERAEECLRQARTIYEAQNMLHSSQQAREAYAYLVLGKTDPDQAKSELIDCTLEYQQKDEKSQTAFTYARLASVAVQNNKLDEAERYLSMSDQFGYGQGTLKDSRAGFTYRVKAEFYMERKEYDLAVKQANNSYAIFDRIGYVREAARSLRLAAKALNEVGNVEEAFKLSDRVNSMLDDSSVKEGVKRG